jgi:hypothetical protein
MLPPELFQIILSFTTIENIHDLHWWSQLQSVCTKFLEFVVTRYAIPRSVTMDINFARSKTYISKCTQTFPNKLTTLNLIIIDDNHGEWDDDTEAKRGSPVLTSHFDYIREAAAQASGRVTIHLDRDLTESIATGIAASATSVRELELCNVGTDPDLDDIPAQVKLDVDENSVYALEHLTLDNFYVRKKDLCCAALYKNLRTLALREMNQATSDHPDARIDYESLHHILAAAEGLRMLHMTYYLPRASEYTQYLPRMHVPSLMSLLLFDDAHEIQSFLAHISGLPQHARVSIESQAMGPEYFAEEFDWIIEWLMLRAQEPREKLTLAVQCNSEEDKFHVSLVSSGDTCVWITLIISSERSHWSQIRFMLLSAVTSKLDRSLVNQVVVEGHFYDPSPSAGQDVSAVWRDFITNGPAIDVITVYCDAAALDHFDLTRFGDVILRSCAEIHLEFVYVRQDLRRKIVAFVSDLLTLVPSDHNAVPMAIKTSSNCIDVDKLLDSLPKESWFLFHEYADVEFNATVEPYPEIELQATIEELATSELQATEV